VSILALWVAGNIGSPLARGVEPEHETEPEPEPRPAAARDLSGEGGEEIVGTLVPEHPVNLARTTQAVRLAKLARQRGEGGGGASGAWEDGRDDSASPAGRPSRVCQTDTELAVRGLRILHQTAAGMGSSGSGRPLLQRSCTATMKCVEVMDLDAARVVEDVAATVTVHEVALAATVEQQQDVVAAMQWLLLNPIFHSVQNVLRDREDETTLKLHCPGASVSVLDFDAQPLLKCCAVDIVLHTDPAQASLQLGKVAVECMQDSPPTNTAVEILRTKTLSGTADAPSVVVKLDRQSGPFAEHLAPSLGVQLDAVEVTLSPECLQSLLIAAQVKQSPVASPQAQVEPAATAKEAEETNPRDSDFVLSDDDMVTADLTLLSTQRLFVQGRPGDEVRLTGNGYSLRLTSAKDGQHLVYVDPGVTLWLTDMLLENWQPTQIFLAEGARVRGVVDLYSASSTSETPRKGLRTSFMSRIRSDRTPSPEPGARPVTGAAEASTEMLPTALAVDLSVTSARLVLLRNNRGGSDTPPMSREESGGGDEHRQHRRAQSDGALLLRGDSSESTRCSSAAAPSLSIQGAARLELGASLRLNMQPTPIGATSVKFFADELVLSTAAAGAGASVEVLLEPLTMVAQCTLGQTLTQLDCDLEAIVVRLPPQPTAIAMQVAVQFSQTLYQEIAAQPEAVAQAAFESALNLTLVLQVASARVELLDASAAALPFTRLEITEFCSSITQADNGHAVHMRGVVAMDCYNRPLSEWEPLVEACEIFIDFAHSDDLAWSAAKRHASLEVRVTDALTLNVTRNVLGLADSCLAPWLALTGRDARNADDALRSERLASVPDAPAYVLRNDTMETLILGLPTDHGGDTSEHTLEPEEELDFDGSFLQTDGTRRTLVLAVGACRAVTRVDRVGVSHVSLVSGNGKWHYHVAVHVVQASDATKHVSIRSEFYIENFTDVPLSLQTVANDVFVVPPYGSVTCTVEPSLQVVPGDARRQTLSQARGDPRDVAGTPGAAGKALAYEWADVSIDGRAGVRQQLLRCAPKDWSTHSMQCFLWSCIDAGAAAAGSTPATGLVHVVLPMGREGGLGMDISNDHAVVTDVRGLAAEAGVRKGWRLIEVAGHDVSDKDAVLAALARAEEEVELCFETLEWAPRDGLMGGMSFRIAPPLTVQNRLPCSMALSFLAPRVQADAAGAGGGGRSGGWLPEGGSVALQPLPPPDGARTLGPGADVSVFHDVGRVHMQLGIEGTFGLPFDECKPFAMDQPCTIRVADSEGRELRLELDSQRAADGRQLLCVWAKAWILNYTGLPLRYAHAESRRLAGVSTDGIFSHRPCICHTDTLRVQVVGEANMFAAHPYDTEWSRTFNIASVGTTGAVSIVDAQRPQAGTGHHRRHCYDLVVAIRSGKGRYRRTRMVALSPQFQLLNRLSTPLFFRQARPDQQPDYSSAAGVAVPPNDGISATPVYWSDVDAPKHLCLRTDFDDDTHWSAAVSAESAYNLALAIPAGERGVSVMEMIRSD
jgi:hypothetical protein